MTSIQTEKIEVDDEGYEVFSASQVVQAFGYELLERGIRGRDLSRYELLVQFYEWIVPELAVVEQG